MARNIRKIDPNLNMGMHELANTRDGPDSFSFQLTYSKDQIEDSLANLDNLVKNTILKAPIRTKKDFCLLARPNLPKQLTHEEDKWERKMHEKWGPQASSDANYVDICPRIQTYQYPLRDSLKKDVGWGEIDLLGIGPDFLPVPNELKQRKSDESPLRMLVQVAAYGFALKKVWPNLKSHWAKAVSSLKGAPAHFPDTLDKVTLVCVAPEERWDSYLGRSSETKAGAFPSEAWPPFWKLVDALGIYFDIHFVALEGEWDEEKQLTINGARVLDLRSDSEQRFGRAIMIR